MLHQFLLFLWVIKLGVAVAGFLYLFGSRLSSFFITFVVRWSELLHKSFSFDLCSVFPIHVKISNICLSDKVANTISNIIKVFLPLKIDHIKIEAVIFRWNLFSTSVRCHVDHFYYHYMYFLQITKPYLEIDECDIMFFAHRSHLGAATKKFEQH